MDKKLENMVAWLRDINDGVRWGNMTIDGSNIRPQQKKRKKKTKALNFLELMTNSNPQIQEA